MRISKILTDYRALFVYKKYLITEFESDPKSKTKLYVEGIE